MGGGTRKRGSKSYAIERYPELKKELEKENPKLSKWSKGNEKND